MKKTSKATEILKQIDTTTKLGDLRKIAKDIKKDHDLALELWASKKFMARQLAILIMDNKQVTPEMVNELDEDMQKHPEDERYQLIDWLMANQLAKDKKGIEMMESWEKSSSDLKRRIFWYYQGRLRWMGQPSPENTEQLLTTIEKKITKEDAAVQWAMNFTAGWIGVYNKKYRSRCVAIGEKTGLYKHDKVSKGCTPNYLPEFITIESKKRNI